MLKLRDQSDCKLAHETFEADDDCRTLYIIQTDDEQTNERTLKIWLAAAIYAFLVVCFLPVC